MTVGMLRTSAVGIVTISFLAVAGCSGGSHSGGVPSAISGGAGAHSPTTLLTSAAADQAVIDYVHCIRSHGVEIEDPTHRAGHQGLSLSLPDGGTPGFAAADLACQHILAPVIAMKGAGRGAPSPTTMNALIAYTRCMRAHDIPVLDPAPADGHISLGNVPGIDNHVGRRDPQFQTADAACRHFLPASVPDDGTGPP
jgi:hypothetical protein